MLRRAVTEGELVLAVVCRGLGVRWHQELVEDDTAAGAACTSDENLADDSGRRRRLLGLGRLLALLALLRHHLALSAPSEGRGQLAPGLKLRDRAVRGQATDDEGGDHSPGRQRPWAFLDRRLRDLRRACALRVALLINLRTLEWLRGRHEPFPLDRCRLRLRDTLRPDAGVHALCAIGRLTAAEGTLAMEDALVPLAFVASAVRPHHCAGSVLDPVVPLPDILFTTRCHHLALPGLPMEHEVPFVDRAVSAGQSAATMALIMLPPAFVPHTSSARERACAMLLTHVKLAGVLRA
mmetsp:Transcript_79924/g.232012  ORF Transcript_79924/g.232012 Transcript_79924/m.232012 type:complete len:295 (-) Transcript_79924:250-1134(-)